MIISADRYTVYDKNCRYADSKKSELQIFTYNLVRTADRFIQSGQNYRHSALILL